MQINARTVPFMFHQRAEMRRATDEATVAGAAAGPESYVRGAGRHDVHRLHSG
jgi:hypothetical protein